MKKQKPFGSWESPISPDFVAGKDRNLIADLQVEQGSLYFLESRPDEGGRQVLMKRDPNGKTLEVLPPKFNVRSRYLEYGGSAYCVRGGVVFFVNFSDQQIYRQDPGLAPVRITADSMSRFADLSYDGKRNRLIALRELQVKPESKNSVCTIDLSNGSVRDLVTGRDFFHCARLNPQGSKIVWIGWDHPNMAWNGTELWLAEIADSGEIRSAEKIAGDSSHGICQEIGRAHV